MIQTDETTNLTRKTMFCKGTVPKTTRKCRAEICETDGKQIYLKLDSGRELQILPKKRGGFALVCEKCEYKNIWYGE